MATEREKKEEARRKAKEERRQKLEKHRRTKEAWLTLRWITKHVEENEEIWEIEKLEREVERRRVEEEWEKSKGFEKISFLKEKERRKREGINEEISKDPPDYIWCWRT